MNEHPPTPQSEPKIPRGPLWTALLIPPLVTAAVNLSLGLALGSDAGMVSIVLVPVLALALIAGFTVSFLSAVGQRFKGPSLVFLGLSYFIGQFLICLALWLGSCSLAFPPLNLH